MRARLTHHALEQMARRGLPTAMVEAVLQEPEQVVDETPGRQARQSRILFPDGRTRLVRVIVDVTDHPPTVVTAYATSRIAKYWRAT